MQIKRSQREALWACAFLLPNLLGFLVFTLVPVIFSLGLSFVKWDILTAPTFVGFANFIKLAGDALFWKCLANTLFLMMIIPIQIMAALGLALLMNRKIKGMTFFRTVYFLPTITNGVAICLLWAWIYNYDFGLLNNMIAGLGDFLKLPLKSVPWITSVKWAKPSLMMMGLWVMMGGYNMILFMAALANVPKVLYEAAAIDGTSPWQRFWYITWPMISPTTFFIGVMAVIGGFQGGFMQAYIMTGGGPERSTTTLEYLIYNHLYSWQHAGYAASIAWVVFIAIFFVTLFNWKFGGRLVQQHQY